MFSRGTQIHTHMCYAEFGEILEGIAAAEGYGFTA